MTAAWLGHENLCSLQYSPTCNCPCPTCGEPLDTFAPDSCKQPEHTARTSTPASPVPADAVPCVNCGDPLIRSGDGWSHHPYGYRYACKQPESVHAGNLQAELDRIEPRYLTTLSDGDGDLG